MRQKEEKYFCEVLNHLRKSQCTEEDHKLFKSCIVKKDSKEYDKKIMHIFPFAGAVEKQNILAYDHSQGEKVIVKCKDTPYGNSKEIELAKGLAWVQTKQNYDNINGLSRLIHVAVGSNYAISSNVDTEDGLTNGAICIMRYIDYRNTPAHKVPSILWVEFRF